MLRNSFVLIPASCFACPAPILQSCSDSTLIFLEDLNLGNMIEVAPARGSMAMPP